MNIRGHEAVRKCLEDGLGTTLFWMTEPKGDENLRWVKICIARYSNVVEVLNILDQAGFSDRVEKGLTFGIPESTPRLEFKFMDGDSIILEDLNV